MLTILSEANKIRYDGQLYSVGDSQPLYSQYYSGLDTMLGGTWVVTDVSVSNGTIGSSRGRAATFIDPFWSHKAKRHLVVLWAGTNDFFFSMTQDIVRDRVIDFCAGRRLAGFYTIVTTILPRTNDGTPATYETERLSYNTWLRSNYLFIGADSLADLAADTRIGDAGDETDLIYYMNDLVHINTGAGADLIRDIVYAALPV